MTTENISPSKPPIPEERKTLRAWLEENDPPAGLVDDLCTMRALVALGCTLMSLDPGLAARHLMTRSELVAMMTAAKARAAEIRGEDPEHVAPIIPAKNLLCAMIIKRPTNGQLNALNEAVLEGSQGTGDEQRKGLKISMLTQLLNKCALFPDVAQRQKIFIDYGDLQLEFAGKCKALGSQAAEEVVGK